MSETKLVKKTKEKTPKIKGAKTGVVLKISGVKTVSVLVEGFKTHPIYKKRYKTSKKYLTHNEIEGVKVGNTVEIVPSRPISKRKTWQVKKVLG